jgi:DNA-3-methyladenine glycosylase I
MAASKDGRIDDGKTRCPWGEGNEFLTPYHDTEWGVPVKDDIKHFEFLCLEAFQAGLSWLIVLKKREAFRKAFAGFDPKKVARFGAGEIEELVLNAAIIRNRRKIEATINNAHRFLEVQKEWDSFSAYIWSFVEGKPVVNKWRTQDEIPASTVLSDLVSADLKKRGFKFMGTTVIYAHLQAIGVVNDHITSCFRYRDLI